ncbi:MAG: NDP-sugar synthase [Pseudomonadota bacterium]
MIRVDAPLGDVTMLRLDGNRIGAQGFIAARAAIGAALKVGTRAILLDIAKASHLRASDIARLVELAGLALPVARLSLVNVQPGPMTALRDYALDEVIPIYATLTRALEAPEVRSGLLARTQAIVLSAGKGSRMAPLTQHCPKPMLDIMGKPVLEHILGHLARYGVRDVMLNPGHLGPQLPAHFGTGERTGQSLFYLNEGMERGGRWVAAPLGSASTLARLVQDHNALMRDTIVMCGDALVNVDLPAMMTAHRAAHADVTIAALTVRAEEVHKYGIMVTDAGGRVTDFQEKPNVADAKSRLANTGIYIVSPRAADKLVARDGADIAGDLLPAILAAGGRVQAFAKPFDWVDIGCGREYAAAWAQALAGRLPWLEHDAVELAPGIWAHDTAKVARLTDIEGPAYLGPDVDIARGASLRGPAVIGAGSVVEAGAFIRNSVLMPQTRAAAGALVDGMIAGPRWAVAHAYADGSEQPWDPVEGLSPLGNAAAAVGVPDGVTHLSPPATLARAS